MPIRQVSLDSITHGVGYSWMLMIIPGYIDSYIILPSTIWGLASGPLVDAGIVNPQSIQIPALIRASLGRGRAGMVGEGKNLWPNVNIDEGPFVLPICKLRSVLLRPSFNVIDIY